MSLRTWLFYILGSPAAIRQLAAEPRLLLVGLVLVLSASIARNYDGAYLAGEPHVLLHGLAASIGNAFILHAMVFALSRMRGERPGFWRGYRTFLGLFWMTAPMAWLYAIPYERWMDPAASVSANAWTLGLVAAWRVLLISRVLAVIWGERTGRMVWIVLAYSDALLLTAIATSPLPMIDFMGGMQHAPEVEALTAIRFLTAAVGVLISPVLLLGALIAAKRARPRWMGPEPAKSMDFRPVLVAVTVLALASTPAVLLAQAEQRERFRIERLLADRRAAEAIATMSAHERGDYPPLWRLIERDDEGFETLALLRRAVVERAPAPWVRELIVSESLHDVMWRVGGGYRPHTPAELMAALESRPAQSAATRQAVLDHIEIDTRFDDDLRARVRELLRQVPAKEPSR